jgi:hypothetical protein
LRVVSRSSVVNERRASRCGSSAGSTVGEAGPTSVEHPTVRLGDREQPVVAELESPAALVNDMVMPRTQWQQIRQIGWPAELPREDEDVLDSHRSKATSHSPKAQPRYIARNARHCARFTCRVVRPASSATPFESMITCVTRPWHNRRRIDAGGSSAPPDVSYTEWSCNWPVVAASASTRSVMSASTRRICW